MYLFFVIYDQIMFSLVRVSNYVSGYIQIPLKEFLDLPFDIELWWIICNSSSPAFMSQKLWKDFSTASKENYLYIKLLTELNSNLSESLQVSNL